MTTRRALAVGLAVAVAVVTLGAPSAAHAEGVAKKCQGTLFPSGPEQFGSCAGNLPAKILWTAFGGSLFKFLQAPPPPGVQYAAEKMADVGMDRVLDDYWGRHTFMLAPDVGLPCCFDPPGENRFVGDKFAFDGLMDFPLPFPISAGLVPIDRYVGPTSWDKSVFAGGHLEGGNLVDVQKLIENGTLGAKATVRVAVAGCCVPLPVNKALISINGQIHELPKPPHQFATLYEVEVPIEEIRFASTAVNGYCPWPALNLILVAHPYMNTLMDWAEISIKSSPPFVLVPGTQTMNPGATVSVAVCERLKAAKTLARLNPLVDAGIQSVLSIAGYDVCGIFAQKTWREFLSVMREEGIPVKTTDDMLQLPSLLNATGGFPMLGADPFPLMPVVPMEYYVGGAAKSMGVGTVRVIAHSKGGVDMLQYLTSDSYKGNLDYKGLNVTSVATLSTPYLGSPLASSWLRGNTEAPTNLTNLIADKGLDQLTQDVDYLVTMMNAILGGGWGLPSWMITAEQNPAVARRLTEQALERWKGHQAKKPLFVTFGANADSNMDDQVLMDCSGRKTHAGLLDLPDCKAVDDLDIPGGLGGIMTQAQYQIVGYGNCRGYDSTGACTGGWGDMVHNDTVVDVRSAALPNALSRHYILDMSPAHGHWDGVKGSIISINSDHSMILGVRARDVWPTIKEELYQAPTTNY